ncbi:MAG: class I SAM-dependent methyltransferase [Spirochaetaceae bacterium]|nr:class I SAM-dependent methyltransferase [Spirochaetaceae bacterium]
MTKDTDLSVEKTEQQAQMLINRLRKRQNHLKKWAKLNNPGMYRLYDKDIPEIPLVLDFFQTEKFSTAVCGALYKRPYYKDDGEETVWLNQMQKAIAEAIDADPSVIFIKQRRRQNPQSQYQKINTVSKNSAAIIIKENSIRYKVILNEYIDVGLFPDMRLLRKKIQRESNNKNILNLFCYTGAFSIAAAYGGAATIDSVDISNTYLEWTKENCELNNIKTFYCHKNSTAAGCRLIRTDARKFLKEAVYTKQKYDIIILDPPVFSVSKKMHGILDIQKDAVSLIEDCLKILRSGGLIYFSSKLHKFTFDIPALTARYPVLLIEDITEKMRDEDFKKKWMPSIWRLTKV